ncbi:MAG: Do family serine endopeptidase [Deltaproteobacteria bacterium]|nr:Do family serine endopeptidase [Deltaproteobacteria bacterium]
MTKWKAHPNNFRYKTFLTVSSLVFAGVVVVSWGLVGRFPIVNTKVEASQRSVDFVHLVRTIRPVVVNISAVKTAEGSVAEQEFGSFWERFFGGPLFQGPFSQQSLGSGFIIDREGFILTNHHVIEDAEKVKVKLWDGREVGTRIVGKDPKTDIALIKIDVQEDVPIASLGDSDRLNVGEWVLAIGNPFGLDNTVTRGIVSAKDRNIGEGPYDQFIQTDASINPGNSGGPLINMRGEVVGINTAILSETGGSIGIGFATPINLVKEILPELKAKGKVSRGWLGVVIQRVTPEIAEALGLDQPRGALVAEITKDGPASGGGVQVGDVVVEFDGKEIKRSSDLPLIVAQTSVGKKVRLKILRNKKELILHVTLGEAKEEPVS